MQIVYTGMTLSAYFTDEDRVFLKLFVDLNWTLNYYTNKRIMIKKMKPGRLKKNGI